MVLGCLGRIHQPAHGSPHKERHTSTDKERKERGQAPFFLLQMKCCLFRVGAGHRVGRVDGGREGGNDGRRRGWGWGGG